MTPRSQVSAACRCEWGFQAVAGLAAADVTIVVDVFSFTTCVDIATARGVAILPYPSKESDGEAFARSHGAVLAGRRGQPGYSLSATSFLTAPAGLRCVLPSPNGATIAFAAAGGGSVVLAGCLRNARAVADAARKAGSTFNVIPGGERWPDGSLRPALEDWLGAGAVLSHLPGARSPEAAAAVTAYEASQPDLAGVLAGCSSGRELTEWGYPQDIALAAALDASSAAPRFDGLAFVAG